MTAEAIHTQGLLDSVKKGIKELKEVLTYYKSDMYQVPQKKVKEIKAKYDKYIQKLKNYEHSAKKLELNVNKDDAGLRQLN